MKKHLFFLLLSSLLFCYSCSDDDNGGDDYKTQNVSVKLNYPSEGGFTSQKDIVITLTSSTGTIFEAKTDDTGKASFTVVAGIYNISATDVRSNNGSSYSLTGSKNSYSIGTDWNNETVIELDLNISKLGGIVFKEIYPGGCQKDDGSGAYAFDQYIVLTNNSDATIDISKLVLACVNPWNSNSSNKDYVNGVLFYEAEKWIPAGMAMWYFTSSKELAPGEDIVIAINNAINNTITYSNSINFANSKYYCTYDPESGFNHTSYYSAPASEIDPSHYLKAMRIAQGTAWVGSQTSPAYFVFIPEETTLQAFNDDSSTTDNYGGSATQARKKVPIGWIVDGIEVFSSAAATNNKRLTGTIDAGFANFTGKQGYTLYRNVDKEATEARAENKDKLVYNYDLGTSGSTDPSGIDAEASIKNGARIIYKDTNNSTNDFHQRSRASLRN